VTRDRDVGAVLQVEAVDGGFVGAPPLSDRRAIFGGHLLGQAMAAAAKSVPAASRPTSLRATFLRAATPTAPLRYHVRALTDGGKFLVRAVEATQGDDVVLHLVGTFQAEETGPAHQVPMPAAPDPESLPTLQERVSADPAAWSDLYHEWDSFDVRYVRPPAARPRQEVPHEQVWLRAPDRAESDLTWHACALAYISDLTFISAALPAHGLTPMTSGLRMASLDHSIWFHRPCRVDQWLLFDQSAPASSHGLGLVLGHLFTEAGELVATVAQQGLIRMRRHHR
jgi:acyl-CoA thioesterase-2